MMRKLLAAFALFLPLCLTAQTKPETKLYEKTMAKPSVKAAEKFLKKFPGSVYAPAVTQMKDSLEYAAFLEANVSHISREEAVAVAGPCLDAIGWKKDNVESILALGGDLSVRILSADGTLKQTNTIPVSEPLALSLVEPMTVVAPLNPRRQYVHFSYRNGDTEFVEVLYLPEEDIVHQATFYGTPLPGGKIEGQSPEMIQGLNLSAETAYLVEKLRSNPLLVQISRADLLTDQSIRWWLSKNPKAQTGASKLVFGKLDAESSLARECLKARKEKGKNCSAAFFDLRGYTVICTVDNSGECTLVWCEPVCRNRKTDQYIRAIFFEKDGTTLDVIFYKGKTTFKKKISVLSQGIWHLK